MARKQEPKEDKQTVAGAAEAAGGAEGAGTVPPAAERAAAGTAAVPPGVTRGAAVMVPAAASAVPAGAASAISARRRQVKVGRVMSNKMEKTVIVTVENTTTHRLYHRYMKKTSKFAAHDAENRCQVGDVVEIVASRPLSRTKRWRVREILKRAE
jgi:small subunit ribosomal protein S17